MAHLHAALAAHCGSDAKTCHDPHDAHAAHGVHGVHGMLLAHRAELREFLLGSGASKEQTSKFEELVFQSHMKFIDLHAAEVKATTRWLWEMHAEDANEERVLAALAAHSEAKAASQRHAVKSMFAGKRILGDEAWRKFADHIADHLHQALGMSGSPVHGPGHGSHGESSATGTSDHGKHSSHGAAPGHATDPAKSHGKTRSSHPGHDESTDQ